MNRRKFMTTAAAAPLAAAPADSAHNAILELRYYRLRNDIDGQRTSEYLSSTFVPAARRAGLGPLGFFNPVIGEGSPFLLALISYPTFEAVYRARETMAADREFQKGWNEFNSGARLGYVRMDNELLRAFDVMPRVAAPPAAKSPRIFELRTYESKDERAALTKIRMFNEAEAGIFQRLGMAPVFFGQALIGRNLPHLTYMLSFENLAARERLWSAFGSDPEWKKLRAQPGYADAEIVSNISNSILRPTAFSEIR